MVNLSCVLSHPPLCLQLHVLFISSFKIYAEELLARKWVQQAHSWTDVHFYLGNSPGVSLALALGCGYTEILPCSCTNCLLPALQRGLQLFSDPSPSLAKWACLGFLWEQNQGLSSACISCALLVPETAQAASFPPHWPESSRKTSGQRWCFSF